MKEIKVKALPGEQIAVLATVTAVQVEEDGKVRYFVKRLPDADIEELIDDDSVVVDEAPKPEKVKREKVKSTLGINVPEQPTEPPMPKKRPGRPKDVLDKIKAEIIEKFENCTICEWFEDYDYEENDISEYHSVGNISDIIKIINKYKAESEVQDADSD